MSNAAEKQLVKPPVLGEPEAVDDKVRYWG